jgi:hypothetical protein
MNIEMDLRNRIAELEAENTALRQRLRSLEPLAGVTAEAYVAELVGGTLTPGLAPHDITGSGGTKFEVKFSRLNIPMKNSSCRRWSWGHPLGFGGAKTFDHLILVAEPDPRFGTVYHDPRSPYVFFAIPFESISTVMRKEPLIQITTNPNRGHGRTAKLMFDQYYVTSDELRKRHNAT